LVGRSSCISSTRWRSQLQRATVAADPRLLLKAPKGRNKIAQGDSPGFHPSSTKAL
jgi:hypothetical protein